MWGKGEWIVRREIWRGKPWLGTVVRVIEDRPGLLVSYLPTGAPFGFPDGDWPGGRHPWHGRGGWEGHGVLMLQRPDDAHAIWLFERIHDGRFSREEVDEIRADGLRFAADLDAGRRWWNETWRNFVPDPGWEVPDLPAGWDAV